MSQRVRGGASWLSCAGLPDIVRLCFGQPCSPCESGRFRRPSPRSAYTHTPSGASPAVIDSLSKVPPGFGPKQSRAWHPREFGAVLGGSASLPLPAPPLPSSSRRYAPQCFVRGIPPPRLATCLTAHPTNRVAACRSVRHSTPRPLPHLPIRRVFLRSFCARRRSVSSLNLAATHPPRFRPHHNLISSWIDFLILLFDGERENVV